jgi:hypothetical protein
MKLLIKFPTKNRKIKFFNVLNKYHQFCDDIENTKFLITLDNDDSDMNSPDVIEILKTFKNTEFIFDDSKSKVDAINRDIELYDDWDIVLLASDDMVPIVKGYDNIIRNNMKTYYPNTDGVLWFNDGYQEKRLNTLCILGKKYYKRFNYIYNPEYKSTWSDNEFMDVANLLRKQTYFNDVIIKHEHPDWGFGNRDQIHQENFINVDYDRNIYLKNKSINFGINK